MASRFTVGETVQTPLGKGVVREARRNGRLLVDVNGRALVIEESAALPLETRKKPGRKHKDIASRDVRQDMPERPSRPAPSEVDLHGLTVQDALVRAEQAVNDALLADLIEIRFIHGQSGGRIRAALHRLLGDISAVRAFRLDPRNAGVTIVSL